MDLNCDQCMTFVEALSATFGDGLETATGAGEVWFLSPSSILYCAHSIHRCWRSLISQSKFNTILCPFHPQVLEKSGFSVQVLPVLSFAFCRLDELYDALSSPGSYSSLVLTSPRVVQAIERALNIADNASGRCRHFFRCLL